MASNANEFLLRLLPMALDCAAAWQLEAYKSGRPLNDFEFRLARRIGVRHPECVRISEVAEMPVPEQLGLRMAMHQLNMLGDNTLGLTLGYGILVRRGHATSRLLAHELRHVCQFESAGSLDAFLTDYLQQIVRCGYQHAPFETDARAHEYLATEIR